MGGIVKIRDYVESDYTGVRLNLEDGGLFDPDWDSQDRLKAKIVRNPGSILVAVVNDLWAVGNAFIVEDGWGAFIFRVVVRKTHRNLGIGSLLVSEAETRVKAKGYGDTSIFVEDDNPELKRWLERLGYVPANSYRCMNKSI